MADRRHQNLTLAKAGRAGWLARASPAGKTGQARSIKWTMKKRLGRAVPIRRWCRLLATAPVARVTPRPKHPKTTQRPVPLLKKLQAKVDAVAVATHTNRCVLMFEDEAGLAGNERSNPVLAPSGCRPQVSTHRYANTPMFGSVCPQDGELNQA